MARPKKKRKNGERLHREPIVRRVAELLDTGTPTKWRWTSEARHGLRAAMCMKGAPWALADKRAEEIVTLARHRIGLSLYPTWTEARGPTPESREFFFCQACGGKLEEDVSKPYCSESCRSTLWHRRNGSAARRDEEARHCAHAIILNGGNVPERPAQRQRQCRHCREFFTVKRSSSIYCSRACATSDRRPQEVQDCLVCAEPFVPVGRALYCSPACLREKNRRVMAERRARLAQWNLRECRVCSETFRARARQVYCGPSCVAQGEAQARGRPVQPYDKACSICSDPFRTWQPRQLTCGPACRSEASRRRAAAHYQARRLQEDTAEPATELALAAD